MGRRICGNTEQISFCDYVLFNIMQDGRIVHNKLVRFRISHLTQHTRVIVRKLVFEDRFGVTSIFFLQGFQPGLSFPWQVRTPKRGYQIQMQGHPHIQSQSLKLWPQRQDRQWHIEKVDVEGLHSKQQDCSLDQIQTAELQGYDTRIGIINIVKENVTSHDVLGK